MIKKRQRVLVVDDDPEILELVTMALEPAFEVRTVQSGEKALEALWRFGPDALLLDLKLPGFSGESLLRLIRSDPRVGQLPVLLISADDSEATLLRLFSAGADDVVAKPFSPLELGARVRAVLRRSSSVQPKDRFEAGPIAVLVGTHQVLVDGKELKVTPTEFSLLHFLLQHPGKVLSKQRLMEYLWGDGGGDFNTRTVDTHLLNLRRKLGAAASCLETVRNVGLRLKV